MKKRDYSWLWTLREDVTYLNHGSFGAVPSPVQLVQSEWQRACASNPMDFLTRKLEPAWMEGRSRLAKWLGTEAENIAFCENATAAMNELAGWFPLRAGDEVLMTDHEYGAVKRIWQRACKRAEAIYRTVELPIPIDEPSRMVAAIQSACSSKTRLLIVSHITSPTAIILPVAEICAAMRKLNVATCVDGPHAILQQRVRLDQIDCDFYTASCHKWLCAPVGSGFFYVHPSWHERIEPLRLSWGRLAPAQPEHWSHELLWTGTRDYSAYLSIPKAVKLFDTFSFAELDARNHQLAQLARQRLLQFEGTEAVTPDSRAWFGWMVGVWLPTGDHSSLQSKLWEKHRIEIPIMHFAGRWLIRVSCHLYNSERDIAILIDALNKELHA